jgi:hypothetical protein
MKVLLRDPITGKYQGKSKRLVTKLARAQDFVTVRRAIEYCRSRGRNTLKLVLKYEHPISDMELPIPMQYSKGMHLTLVTRKR